MFRATGFGAAPHQSVGHARRGICLCGGQGPTYRQMRCWLSPKERESHPQPPRVFAQRRCETLVFLANVAQRGSNAPRTGTHSQEELARQHGGKKSLTGRAVVNAEEIRKLFYRNRLAHLKRLSETHGRGENSLAAARPQTACRKGLRNCRGKNGHAIPTSAATQTTQVVGERFLRHLRIRHLPERYS